MYRGQTEESTQEEMMRIVKSEEAKEAIEDCLKEYEPRALTSEGVIQSYKIDYSNIKHNPMGGIGITIIINNSDKLNIKMTLVKDGEDNKIEVGGYGVSFELSKQVKGEK